MRVLGEADGKLCFVTSDILSYVPANSTYLNVQEGSPAILPTDGTTGITGTKVQTKKVAKGRFTLQGVRLPDNVEPQKGYYIEDGKLFIKK